MHSRTCSCGKEHNGPGSKCNECLHKQIGGYGQEHIKNIRSD